MQAAVQVLGQRTTQPHEPNLNLPAYRAAVAEMRAEIASMPDRPGRLEATLGHWAAVPEVAAVLRATPSGLDRAIQRLYAELRRHQPATPHSTMDRATLAWTHMLAQIDVAWWGRIPPYQTDEDVWAADELVDLDPLRRHGYLLFRYRRQHARVVHWASRTARRRLRLQRSPHTAGLRLPRTRPETVAMLNLLAAGFSRTAPPDTPPLWVASLTRSVTYENFLRALGYVTMPPSGHCTGYAADLEVRWFYRYGAHRALTEVLLDARQRGDLNVIDEGPAWHICLSPSAAAHLRHVTEAEQQDIAAD